MSFDVGILLVIIMQEGMIEHKWGKYGDPPMRMTSEKDR